MSIKNMFKKIYIYNQLKYNQRRLHRHPSTNPFKPVRPVLTLQVGQVTTQGKTQTSNKKHYQELTFVLTTQASRNSTIKN